MRWVEALGSVLVEVGREIGEVGVDDGGVEVEAGMGMGRKSMLMGLLGKDRFSSLKKRFRVGLVDLIGVVAGDASVSRYFRGVAWVELSVGPGCLSTTFFPAGELRLRRR